MVLRIAILEGEEEERRIIEIYMPCNVIGNCSASSLSVIITKAAQ